MKDRITKKEALTVFSGMEIEGCEIVRWREYVDTLHLDGVISKWQKYTWKKEKSVVIEPVLL